VNQRPQPLLPGQVRRLHQKYLVLRQHPRGRSLPGHLVHQRYQESQQSQVHLAFRTVQPHQPHRRGLQVLRLLDYQLVQHFHLIQYFPLDQLLLLDRKFRVCQPARLDLHHQQVLVVQCHPGYLASLQVRQVRRCQQAQLVLEHQASQLRHLVQLNRELLGHQMFLAIQRDPQNQLDLALRKVRMVHLRRPHRLIRDHRLLQ